MIKTIIHIRNEYFPRTTIGELQVDGKKLCYTLEDTVRAYGIKVYGETAIPANNTIGYTVTIKYSPSFKRNVLVLSTESDNITINYSGIKFVNVYAHGGNKHKDTLGCVLVAKNKSGNKIQGTYEKELFDLVQSWINDGHIVKWYIINKPSV